jgi:hypothetical protein
MNWLRRWVPQFAHAAKPKRLARSFRPQLEALEDRRLLTPTAPTLLSPNGSAPPTTAFSWSPVPDAGYYNFQIVDQTINQTIQGPNLTVTTLTLGSPLRLGDTYVWSVQAVDSGGNLGAWSSFTFSVTNLLAPTLIGPSGPAVPQPVFSWSALTDATHYDIWVQNQNTNQILRDQNVSGTSWVPAAPLPEGSAYTWWVRGIDANGIGGPWSASLVFTESVLPAPTLVGPSSITLPAPTFSWDLVPGADHYDIWLQDVTTAQVIRDTNVPGTTWTPTSPLLQLNNYKWWVRAIDPNGYAGQWSTSLAFTVYALPPTNLTGPSGVTTTLPAFSWDAVTGADHYDIYVQDQKTGQVLRDTTVATISWVPASPLAPGDTYTWWARAMDASNSPGPWSASDTFTAFALPAPTLIAPSGSAATLPTFTWNAVTGANHYDVYVQDMNTGAVLRNTSVSGTSWTPNSPLAQGDTYTWWVRALDNSGHGSPWSASLSFSIASLPAPTLIAPVGAGTLQPTFSWNAVAGADHYDVWVQDVKTGKVLRNANALTTTWTPATPLMAGDSYKWWVRALDSNNSPGPWSSAQTFTAYALAAPSLIGPTGSSPATPAFTWNAVSGADHYDIWVTNRTTGQSAVIRNQDVVGTSWSPTAPLVGGDSYRWWLRAVTSANMDSAWSAPLDFTAPGAS